jgi:hypothetical protein
MNVESSAQGMAKIVWLILMSCAKSDSRDPNDRGGWSSGRGAAWVMDLILVHDGEEKMPSWISAQR